MLILSFLILFFLSSCSPPPTKNPQATSQLRVNIADEPQSLDPRKARDIASQNIALMLFEGLTRINPLEKPEGALAKKIDVSKDLKTYTFYLRKSEWTNGEPVTAEDFVYSWKKVLDPNFLSSNAFQLYVIKNAMDAKMGKITPDEIGIRALDSKTLEVELENPIPYFLELLALPIFFPINKKIDLQNPLWAENLETYVSNGPFSLKQWKHHDYLELEKNDHYWDLNNVNLSKISLVMVKEDTELKMFEKKELDWAGSPLSILPLDALPHLKKTGVLQSKPFLATCFLRTNTEHAPFNHPQLRKAFALAIDRKAIVEYVTQGGELPAMGLVPSVMGFENVHYFKDGDKQKAQELFQEGLKELNITQEQFPETVLLYVSSERNHLIAQILQQHWFETFGIWIKLQGIEQKVYYDALSRQDFQIAISSWIADFNDPINFLEVFKYKQASTNNTLWENPEYVQLLDQARNEKDILQRLTLLKKCENLLMNAMPIIPIFHYRLLYLNHPHIKNTFLTPMGHVDFKWTFIEDVDKEK